MKKTEFTFLFTFFDKEELRKATIILDREGIEFKINNKSGQGHFRAPLATYIEADVMVRETDFEKAAGALKL